MSYKIVDLNSVSAKTLGGAIHDALMGSKSKFIKCASISIKNDYFYGCYDVPMDIGLSTPISLLKDGRVCINLADPPVAKDNDMYSVYKCSQTGMQWGHNDLSFRVELWNMTH